VLHQQVISITD